MYYFLHNNLQFKDVIKKFGLEPNTTDFVGHAVALYTNDNFLDEPSLKTIDNIKVND